MTAMNANYSSEIHTSDYKRNELQEMLIAPPLDLSFRKATTMDELMEKRAQIIRTRKAPTRTMKDRYVTSTLWLSNNLLSSMEGLQRLVDKVLDVPMYLSWLDLSFNEISEIGEDIEKFTNLKILYLHGNKISNIADTVRLRKLENLRSLTLHGNPIEDVPCYRDYIVHLLPQLLVLDFSSVIAAEKKKALPVGFFKMIQPGLLAARVQSKPQVTKLFPVEGTYQKQLSNTTKPLENFLGKLRTTYNFIFRQTDFNNTNNVEKILAKDAPASDLQAMKLIWIDTIKSDKYANLKYPNNSFLDQIKSLSILKNYENKANSSNLEKESSIKIATIKANEKNMNSMNSDKKNSNKTETLLDDNWFNDVQPLEQLELQEEINKKNEVEIVTARTTLQSPTRVGHQLIEWLGSLFTLTHGIYAKLSGTACANEKMQ